MIFWLKRAAAFLSGLFIFLLLYPEFIELAVLGGVINMVWAADDKLPRSCRPFFHPVLLVFNTVCSAFVVLKGGSTWWAMGLAGSSLIAWNIGIFRQSSRDTTLTLQHRYLRHLGYRLGLGSAAGFSALALQGRFSSSFSLTFFLMLASGFLFLRLLSGSMKKQQDRATRTDDAA
jgi:hypothetical protein